MKQTDIKPCAYCGKGLMHESSPIFYRVKFETMGFKIAAIKRQVGLEMVLGGNATIANAMGPNEDMAERIGDAKDLLFCNTCMTNPFLGLMQLIDMEPKK